MLKQRRHRRILATIGAALFAATATLGAPTTATAASGSASGGGCTINYASWFHQPTNQSHAWTQVGGGTCNEVRVRLQYPGGSYGSWDYKPSLAIRNLTGHSPKAQHGFRVGSSWYGLNSTPHTTYG